MPVRELRLGMRGEDVRAVQKGLNQVFAGLRTPLKPDGVFGPQTFDAVREFQALRPGTGGVGGPDGVVGGRTRHALFPLKAVTVHAMGVRKDGGMAVPRFGAKPVIGAGGAMSSREAGGATPGQIERWSREFSLLGREGGAYKPRRFPGLRLALPVPELPAFLPSRGPVDLRLRPSLSSKPSARNPMEPVNLPPARESSDKGPDSHYELSPGVQTVFGQPRKTQFTLGLQYVLTLGDGNAAHVEVARGIQYGSSDLDNDPWSLTWYVQVTDVDRLGHFGKFHLWQPFAQVGVQNSSQGSAVTLQLVPANIGFDLDDTLSLSLQTGVNFAFDPRTGVFQSSFQGAFGLIVKFGGSD